MVNAAADQDTGCIGTDPDAFERFYRKHVDGIERFVVRRVADPHLAADLTAEVFLAAIRSPPGNDPTRVWPPAWLFGVARNVVASHFRSGARERQVNQLAVGRRVLDDDDIARLHERIDAEAASRRLYSPMDRLSDAERAVLELVALDGLGPQDAARVLGISATAARARLRRARIGMRDHLSQPVLSGVVRIADPTEELS